MQRKAQAITVRLEEQTVKGYKNQSALYASKGYFHIVSFFYIQYDLHFGELLTERSSLKTENNKGWRYKDEWAKWCMIKKKKAMRGKLWTQEVNRVHERETQQEEAEYHGRMAELTVYLLFLIVLK